MQNTVSLYQPKRRNFMRVFFDRFTNTKESATQKHDDLLNSPAVRPSAHSPSSKAVSPVKNSKFFAGVTRADGKADSAFTTKSLSFI